MLVVNIVRVVLYVDLSAQSQDKILYVTNERRYGSRRTGPFEAAPFEKRATI
jgi:hypothetical protein